MADPSCFDVAYVINVHMEGQVGAVDTQLAYQQWDRLRQVYEELGFAVFVLEAVSDLPDLVFTANQCFPLRNDQGARVVIPSRMHAEQRRAEVPIVRAFFEEAGYIVEELPASVSRFESMGDALWHPGRRLIYGGWGQRTAQEAYAHISQIAGAPVVLFELLDPRFYHLDTCLSVIHETCAVAFPGAFTADGWNLLKQCFPDLIEVSQDDAVQRFACNGHSPDGRHFIVEPGCDGLMEALEERGITTIEVATSEFRKSGGSVFCMKMMWDETA